jgi:predicted XRE-type DNA-binding protein
MTITTIILNVNKSRVSLMNRLKCDCPALNKVKNIFVITDLTITTLFAR